ncbi:MAG: hypothetical protein DF168_01859 [Candidatus Moanabacter tarae]|uniref:Uncharacterized protein n=1 Tax=Candidatus Moanibacter tarae TaxID=2200854 RepID=A0A2Z4ARI2_9BACT|nr:MAG: hypothetical protein DF168_01859 [Candidatus Moanabacter tarae]
MPPDQGLVGLDTFRLQDSPCGGGRVYRLLDPLKAVELENDWLPVAFDFSVLNVFFSELP